jgi:murein DD-endopeptidase MepM/ murein hydrolase activator NlpD
MGLPPADMDTCGMMGVYTYNILFSDAARKHKDRPIFPEEFPELLGIDISDWQYPLDTINGRKRNCEDKFYFAIGEQNGDPWTGMSQFGWIRTDKYGNHRTHAAIDLYGEVGEPVYAMAKGIVTRILPTGYYEGTGQIIIAHKNDKNQEKYLSARYSEINVDYDNDKTLNVKTLRVGDNVEAGQIIGHQMIPTGNMVMVHLEIYCGFKPADTNIILAPKGNHGSYHRDDTLMYPMWVYYLPASPNHNIKTL